MMGKHVCVGLFWVFRKHTSKVMLTKLNLATCKSGIEIFTEYYNHLFGGVMLQTTGQTLFWVGIINA